MALPNQINKDVPAGADLPSTIDNRIRNLALAVEDLFGVPDQTNISLAAMAVSTNGASRTVYVDTAANPATNGHFQRNGSTMVLYDGSAVRTMITDSGTQTLTSKTLTSPTLNTAVINTPNIDAPTITGDITVTPATTMTTSDARTATVDIPLTLTSTTSGAPATGIGTGTTYRAESTDENPSDVGQIDFTFSDVGPGTEDSYFQVLLRVAGAALTSCYRFVATGAFNAIFTHANTAARTYTLPNYTQSLAGVTEIVADTALPAANNVDITNIPQTFSSLVLTVKSASSDTATRTVHIQVSTDNGSSFASAGAYGTALDSTSVAALSNVGYIARGNTQTAAQVTTLTVHITGYQIGPYLKATWGGRYADTTGQSGNTEYESTAAVDALRITWDSTGNFDGGTYSLHGLS